MGGSTSSSMGHAVFFGLLLCYNQVFPVSPVSFSFKLHFVGSWCNFAHCFLPSLSGVLWVGSHPHNVPSLKLLQFLGSSVIVLSLFLPVCVMSLVAGFTSWGFSRLAVARRSVRVLLPISLCACKESRPSVGVFLQSSNARYGSLWSAFAFLRILLQC